MTKNNRLKVANEFIKIIASCGRKFFYNDGDLAYLYFNEKGRLIYVDEYTKAHIQTQKSGFCPYPFDKKSKFSHGGTLAMLVENLRNYIIKGEKLWAEYFQPVLPNGFKNYWGYGDDILIIKNKGLEIGILE